MTYVDLLKEVQCIIKGKIKDYRPAYGMYIDGMNSCEHIPNAIICWLEDGSEVIYIKKGADNEH